MANGKEILWVTGEDGMFNECKCGSKINTEWMEELEIQLSLVDY